MNEKMFHSFKYQYLIFQKLHFIYYNFCRVSIPIVNILCAVEYNNPLSCTKCNHVLIKKYKVVNNSLKETVLKWKYQLFWDHKNPLI